MPNASAPKAPWVEVCESPQTIVMPGWVTPSSGPITWTMPWRRWPSGYSVMPNSSQFRDSASSWACDSSSGSPGPVGTLWSAVASVRSGRRTGRPANRSPSKACGLVTSWTRCRSMNSSPSPTRWASQTFSNIVRGAIGAVYAAVERAGFSRASAQPAVRVQQLAGDPAALGREQEDDQVRGVGRQTGSSQRRLRRQLPAKPLADPSGLGGAGVDGVGADAPGAEL